VALIKRLAGVGWGASFKVGNDRGPDSGPGRGLNFSPAPAPAGTIKIINRGRGNQIAVLCCFFFNKILFFAPFLLF